MPPALAKGDYSPSTAQDIRGPCPLVNCLANHGYISRDGRNVLPDDLYNGLRAVGISRGLGAAFAYPIFLERDPPKPTTIWAKMWYYLRNPWAIVFSAFGMRKNGQFDAAGRKCLDLNQLALPGVVEHDISLTRRDFNQGDNISRQMDLIEDLLAASSDGGKTLTMEDLAVLRRRRIEQQAKDNPGLHYESLQHDIGSTEIALILNVFGDGKRIPCDRARAFFAEERLPTREGWKAKWWSLGFLKLVKATGKAKTLVGVTLPVTSSGSS